MAISKDREKIYNMCGESVKIFTVLDNAPLCKDCIPIKEIKEVKKELANEETMLKKLITGNVK